MLDALAAGGRRDFTFLVVGDGPCRQALEERAAELPFHTVFTGMVPHDRVRDYYQLGDLFLTASTSETQGLTYFEALAAGVPVLCRRDLCVQGVVEDGVNGWQWEEQADLLACLDRFLEDPALRDALARGARQSALALFRPGLRPGGGGPVRLPDGAARGGGIGSPVIGGHRSNSIQGGPGGEKRRRDLLSVPPGYRPWDRNSSARNAGDSRIPRWNHVSIQP